METQAHPGPPTRRRGRAVTLTVRGAAMLAAAAIALVVAYIAGWPELLLLACFAGIPPLLALLHVSRMRPRLTVARFTSPAIVAAGSTGSASLRVVNEAGRRTAAGRWRDGLPWGAGSTQAQDFAPLEPGGVRMLQYAFTPSRRGLVDLGPLSIDVGDPFGLARGEFAVGDRQRLVVAPETVALEPGAIDIASESGSARLFQHRALAGEHDIMTRDYRPGDALRKVHWKASAHHGGLMVREDEKRSHAEALLVVDTRRGSYRDVSRVISPDHPESERFEWALRMVASLREHLVHAGLHVRVAETAVAQLADPEHAEDFVESLARVRLSYQDAPVIRLAGPQQDDRGTVFAVLDAPDRETVEALLGQGGAFTLAVAFLLGEASPGSGPTLADRLVGAGWLVHRVAEGETVERAWIAAGEAGEATP